MINPDLEKLKEIFLSKDIDDEDYDDNLRMISDWEASIRNNEDFSSWQESDVTKSIVEQVKQSFKDNAMRLIKDRDLAEKDRLSIWSKQDAMVWLLSLVEKDSKKALEQIHRDIKQALKVE